MWRAIIVLVALAGSIDQAATQAPLIDPRPPPEIFDAFTGQIHTQITMILTGRNAEQFGVATVAPIYNPARCPNADGYMTDSAQPGYHTYYAAALLAFAERADVVVVVAVQGCVADHPKLIGLKIVR